MHFQRCIDYVDISLRSAASGASNKRGVGKISYLSLTVNISKPAADTAKVTISA